MPTWVTDTPQWVYDPWMLLWFAGVAFGLWFHGKRLAAHLAAKKVRDAERYAWLDEWRAERRREVG